MHEFAIDGQFQIDQARHPALADHDIIQRIPCALDLTVAYDAAAKQQTFILGIFTRQYPGDGLQHGFRGQVGQKAQTPLIDAHQRNPMIHQFTCRQQHAAVAAEHHSQVCTLPNFMQRRDGIPLNIEMAGSHFLDHDADLARVKKIGKCQHMLPNTGVGDFADQRYGLKCFLHARI